MRVRTDSEVESYEVAVVEEPTEQDSSENSQRRMARALEDITEEKADPELGDASADDNAEAADTSAERAAGKRRSRLRGIVAFGLLPVLVLLLAAAAGFLKWQDSRSRMCEVAGIESVAAAKDSTAALLTYQPGTVERDLAAAGGRLTGKFKDSYTQLVHDVVVPGAKKDHIAALATVPAAAAVAATPDHAVVLVFVNQTVTVGNDAPADTASTVRVTLDKSGGRWLISAFDPI